MPRKRKGTIEEQQQRDKFTKWRSFFRRAWIKYPERLAVINDPLTKRKYTGSNKKQKWEHLCVICDVWQIWRTRTMVIDHISPCGKFDCEEDFKVFLPNLFCSREKLQKLCKKCHDQKTLEERQNG